MFICVVVVVVVVCEGCATQASIVVCLLFVGCWLFAGCRVVPMPERACAVSHSLLFAV